LNDSRSRTAEARSTSQKPGIQVIARAASVLRALEDEPAGLSLGEIALRVELPRSTVQRIVAALANEQLLIAATPQSRVRLGPALIRLASATKLELNQLVRPHMETLARDLNETVDLSVIQGKAAVFIDQITANQRLRAVSAVGERFPLHSTACGKALLATLTPEKLSNLLNNGLESYTPNTVTNAEELADQIAAIRESGEAYDMEEYTEGICAVGTFFVDPLGRSYAISIPTPTARFMRNKRVIRNKLLECRKSIVALLEAKSS
jgi:DNA-binding IclR family transcriptional regulator